MPRIPTRAAPDAASFHDYFGQGRVWLTVLVPILLLSSIAAVRGVAPTGLPATPLSGAVGLDATELTDAAANKLEAATAVGGAG